MGPGRKSVKLTDFLDAEPGSKLPAPGKTLKANLPEASRQARDDAATLLNVSRRSIQHALVVLDRGTPELVSAVEAGDTCAYARNRG